MLAALLLREQGIDITLVCFATPFFSSDNARAGASQVDMELTVVDITMEHLTLLRDPPHGFGAHMNPCIDCHALMLRRAGDLMAELGAGFVFSGEVLGQRPFSQNKRALAIVAALSGLDGLLLRPLSAKLLPMTRPEREGWVDRERLLDISGRSRRRQIQLAERFGFIDYPTPAGGCSLTEASFSARLRDLLDRRKPADPEVRELELLKVGRHFTLTPVIRLVVGRDQRENERIQALYRSGDDLLSCEHIPGPVGLIPGGADQDSLQLAARITAAYSDAETGSEVTALVIRNERESIMAVTAPAKEDFKERMI